MGSNLDPYRTACEDRNDKFLRACRKYLFSACVSLDSDLTTMLLRDLWKKK